MVCMQVPIDAGLGLAPLDLALDLSTSTDLAWDTILRQCTHSEFGSSAFGNLGEHKSVLYRDPHPIEEGVASMAIRGTP